MRAPEGCILNARHPSATGGRHLVGHFIPSTVMGALADLVPQGVMAPGFDGLWDTHLSGRERGSDRFFSFTWFSAGGTGALAVQDGLSAAAYPSAIAGVPVEVMEVLAPIVVGCRELTLDSGGAGRFRGGLGQTMSFGLLTDEPFLFSGLYERTRHPAPGLAGGHAGSLGRVRNGAGEDQEPKTNRLLPPETSITIDIPGGGGFGPSEERDPARVLEDVKDGYVSPEAARERYRVVIDAESEAVDEAATAELRNRT